MPRIFRLAILAPHPVPYHVPLYRALAAHPAVRLNVLYCSDLGVSGQRDPGFGIPLRWGIPFLDGYPFRFLRNLSPFRTPGHFFSLLNPGILVTLFRERYDAVLIPGYSTASFLLGFLAAWFSQTPVFLRGETVLRPPSPFPPRALLKNVLVRTLLKGTRACLAIGTPSHQFYRAYQVPEERIFFSPYGVDNDFFTRESRRWREMSEEVKRSLGLAADQPVVLFCGKLTLRKRPMDLLTAFLRITHPASLLFVGEGSLRSQLERQAQGHPGVRFTGFIPQGELPRYYAVADLFVLPSSNQEVAPLVVNEAMACGLPVVLSDAIPSAVDFVRPGENGFTFPCGDVQAIQGCLDRLLQDRVLRREMGRRSLQMIQGWSPEAAVAGILRALEEVDQC